eukprot:TRINITY_DN60918_c0_g1_i1.p1 TRINITY_DN60918_c0_g1~~TRINITY_DN60918_c0_g1_i1.p1  ORF type:complete len:253 (-),score=38.51 TRINITY_DN60918_c0_g1_i1:64-822(-)
MEMLCGGESEALAVFAEDQTAFHNDQASALLRTRAQQLEELRQSLEQQRELEREASQLMVELCRLGRTEADSCWRVEPVEPGPPSASQLRLARESAEFRLALDAPASPGPSTGASAQETSHQLLLERCISTPERPGVAAWAPRDSRAKGSQTEARREQRRMQQLDVLASHLHSELKRSLEYAPPSQELLSPQPKHHTSTPSPTRSNRPEGAPGSVASGTSRASVRSERLEQQSHAFCRKFLLRRDGMRTSKS